MKHFKILSLKCEIVSFFENFYLLSKFCIIFWLHFWLIYFAILSSGKNMKCDVLWSVLFSCCWCCLIADVLCVKMNVGEWEERVKVSVRVFYFYFFFVFKNFLCDVQLPQQKIQPWMLLITLVWMSVTNVQLAL